MTLTVLPATPDRWPDVEAIFGANIVAEMAGDLMVREGERGARKFAKSIALAAGDGSVSSPFTSMPWTDAVEEWRNRSNVSSGELSTLLRNTVTRSREEQRKLLENIQEAVRDNLAYAIADGETYADFAVQIAAVLGRKKLQAADYERAAQQTTEIVLRGLGLKVR